MEQNMRLIYGTGNPYYYDLDKDELDTVAVEDGFLQFFQTFLNTYKKD